MATSFGRPRFAAALAITCALVPAPAFAAERNFNIPAQSLASALTTWSRQANMQIFFPSEKIKSLRAPALKGSMTPRAALERLIAGSNLRIANVTSGAFVLAEQAPVRQPAAISPRAPAPSELAESELPASDIIVTGIRQSLETARDIKRDSDKVVDAVGAEDVGKFPDENVADSLQRVTGVQITRARGEGSFATIRGLPSYMNLVQFNGHTMLSAIGPGDGISRTFQYSILPSEFVGSLEVYKSPTADMEEGGLAGTIVVRTPRPLKIGKRKIVMNAQGSWESNTGKIAPRLSGIYSDVFADGKLGVTLGVAYAERKTESHTVDFYGFRTDLESIAGGLDLNGDGKVVKTDSVEYGQSNYFYLNTENTQRLSAIGVVEFQPNETLNLYAEGFYGELAAQVEQQISFFRWVDTKGPTVPGEIETGPGLNTTRALRFMADGVDVRALNPYDDRKGHLVSVSAGGKFESGPWKLSFEGSYSDTHQVNDALNLATSGRFRAGYDATVDRRLMSVFYGGGDYQRSLDPSNFSLVSINGQFNQHDRARNKDVRFDLDREVDFLGIRHLVAGFKYSDRWQFRDSGSITISAAEINQLLGGTLQPGPGGTGFSAAPFLRLARPSNGSFLSSYHGASVFPEAWLVSDIRSIIDRFSDEELLAAGDGKNFTNDPVSIVDVSEQAYAGYAQAMFGDKRGPVSGNIGVRVVKTFQSTTGVSPDLTAMTYNAGTGRTTVPATAPAVVERDYVDVLPSANLRWNAGDNLVVRAAASKTMARANLPQMTATVIANAANRTLTKRNPYLEPFRATNFDIGLEWYFGRRNLLSVAAFYKDLESLTENEVRTEYYTVTQINADGSTQPVELDFKVTQPVNVRGVKLKGIEVGYQQQFDFLPKPFDGLGVVANYTFLDNSAPDRLTATSKHSFNLSAYYENRRFSVRASYSFRDRFLSYVENETFDGEQMEPFGTLDASATLNLTRNISAVVQASNLLDADKVQTSTHGTGLLYEDPGRRIVFGVRGRF